MGALRWQRSVFFVLAASTLQEVLCVDRSKFRTCTQGSFCRRYREWVLREGAEEALWSVLGASRLVEEGALTFRVKHAREKDAHLKMTLDAYESGIVRIRLNELDPLHPRYVIPPGDAIAEILPPHAKDLVVVDGSDATLLTFSAIGGTKVAVEVRHSPLMISVEVGGRLIQRLNSRNHLNFERYRRNGQRLPPDASNDLLDHPEDIVLDAAARPGVHTNGLWEEAFGGHTDRKPRGPAAVGLDITFEGDVPNLFGLPEHMTKAGLPFYEEPYRFYNLDVFEYENNESIALYGAVPLLWAIHRSDGASATSSALLWVNPSETFVKLERAALQKGGEAVPAHTWWVSESGVLDIAVLAGPTPAQVSRQLHDLTGYAPIPPLWALGKHQCRWNYMNEKDVATVDAGYDRYDIPYDTMWLDIEHTDAKKYFTWHSENFRTPENMLREISAKRRMFVNVVDPHIKKDDKYWVYNEIAKLGFAIKKAEHLMMDDPTDSEPEDWVKDPMILDPGAQQPPEWNEDEDGVWMAPEIDNPSYKGAWKPRRVPDPNAQLVDFEGWCWPGTSIYPDFTDPRMREYWGSLLALDKYSGSSPNLHIWNDMNEPSVFNGPEVTMPRDAIHPHGNVEHRDVHNIYGYYVHRATFEGLAKRVPGDRPFVLTRSFFVGSHKYCAIWTGDNTADWEHLQASIPMIGALAVAGQSLVGADVGGFFKHPSPELIVRWYQLAVFAYPFLRSHAHLETPRREPFVYDKSTMNLIKASLQLRYRMLPLWYTLFQEYHRFGHPVVRPLFWDFISDANTHTDDEAVENQLMVGGTVLVHGVSEKLADSPTTSVYLPEGPGWYDLHSSVYVRPGHHTVQLDLHMIPAYHLAGTVVPLKMRSRRSSAAMALDPHTLQVYLDPARQTARGRLYVDDYRTHGYQDGQSFLETELVFEEGKLRASARAGRLPDAAAVSTMVERVDIIGLRQEPAGAAISLPTGQTQVASLLDVRRIGDFDGSHLIALTIKVVPNLDLAAGSGWHIDVK